MSVSASGSTSDPASSTGHRRRGDEQHFERAERLLARDGLVERTDAEPGDRHHGQPHHREVEVLAAELRQFVGHRVEEPADVEREDRGVDEVQQSAASGGTGSAWRCASRAVRWHRAGPCSTSATRCSRCAPIGTNFATSSATTSDAPSARHIDRVARWARRHFEERTHGAGEPAVAGQLRDRPVEAHRAIGHHDDAVACLFDLVEAVARQEHRDAVGRRVRGSSRRLPRWLSGRAHGSARRATAAAAA